jgi:hypothetical protein
MGRDHLAGAFFRARGWFDLDVQAVAVAQAELRNVVQSRQGLAGVSA